MMARNKSVMVTLAFMLLLGVGCKKKKQPVVLAAPPTIAAPAPAKIEIPQTPAGTAPATTTPANTSAASKPKPVTPKPKKPVAAKPKPVESRPATIPPQVAQNNPPPRIVIDAGPDTPSPGMISAGMPHSNDIHQRQTTAQLNESTEANIASLRQPLSASQQTLVQQVQSFLAQSRAATTDGDTVRAHNLALKAHLLSDELVRK